MARTLLSNTTCCPGSINWPRDRPSSYRQCSLKADTLGSTPRSCSREEETLNRFSLSLVLQDGLLSEKRKKKSRFYNRKVSLVEGRGVWRKRQFCRQGNNWSGNKGCLLRESRLKKRLYCWAQRIFRMRLEWRERSRWGCSQERRESRVSCPLVSLRPSSSASRSDRGRLPGSSVSSSEGLSTSQGSTWPQRRKSCLTEETARWQRRQFSTIWTLGWLPVLVRREWTVLFQIQQRGEALISARMYSVKRGRVLQSSLTTESSTKRFQRVYSLMLPFSWLSSCPLRQTKQLGSRLMLRNTLLLQQAPRLPSWMKRLFSRNSGSTLYSGPRSTSKMSMIIMICSILVAEGDAHQVIRHTDLQGVSRPEVLSVHGETHDPPGSKGQFYCFGPVVLALGGEHVAPEGDALQDVAHGKHIALQDSHIQELVIYLGERGHSLAQGVLADVDLQVVHRLVQLLLSVDADLLEVGLVPGDQSYRRAHGVLVLAQEREELAFLSNGGGHAHCEVPVEGQPSLFVLLVGVLNNSQVYLSETNSAVQHLLHEEPGILRRTQVSSH